MVQKWASAVHGSIDGIAVVSSCIWMLKAGRMSGQREAGVGVEGSAMKTVEGEGWRLQL